MTIPVVMTICVHCKHHHGPTVGMWYDHECGHPKFQRSRKRDPVSGVIPSQADCRPYCRDINYGDCAYYEE